MKREEIKAIFQPSGRSVYVLPDTSVLEAAGEAGIILQTPCGGRGVCGKCLARVAEGQVEAPAGRGPLSAKRFAEGYRQACQARLKGPATIYVPAESLFESRQKILTRDAGHRGNLNPVVRKTCFELPAPTSGDPAADVSRLCRGIGDVAIADDCLNALPRFLRSNGWRGTAVLIRGRLVALEPGDTSKLACGIAFDIGTTTVVGTLFDLTDGKELGLSSQLNAQIAYGDDVISRIHRIRQDPAMLNRLQDAIRGTVNEIIARVTQDAGIASESVYEVTIAGNSTMQQILCGYDPSALGEAPFVHVFDQARALPARRLGLRTNANAEVFVYPQIGGFVGGDTVAGMVAARLDKWDKPVILIDIGTNGEIVLARGKRILATSTAAGPAFEGARIAQGMRATTGAIEKVILRNDVVLNVIGNVPPVGLCGTTVIDAVAELLRLGVVDETGRIQRPDEVPPRVPRAIRRRIVTKDGDPQFVLADADETGTGKPICLWQRDIRELQLASGAIRAGINILLKRLNLTASDVGSVLLAGAFGNFIRRSNARRIGLMPPIPRNSIRSIGNAASLGAKLALLSEDERKYAEQLRQKTEHVDLSLDPEFQAEFGAAMLFPGPEADACAGGESGMGA
ncbi:MAG: ASKHA domain-containing protein [Verrucomicrobiota bacterium]|nr:ASKHA domain-containing protein [Verrucomicrobiota bacterium]